MKNKYEAATDLAKLVPISTPVHLVQRFVNSIVQAVLYELADGGLITICSNCSGIGEIWKEEKWEEAHFIDCEPCNGRGFLK